MKVGDLVKYSVTLIPELSGIGIITKKDRRERKRDVKYPRYQLISQHGVIYVQVKYLRLLK